MPCVRITKVNMRNILTQLHSDIETRVQSIRGNNPVWPCRMGCDACCRELADIPKLSAVEWELLKEGLATLPQEQLREIGLNIAALADEPPPSSIVCPLLDQSIGACGVYAYRPVVCRTYGFYVRRGMGIYCKKIESLVTEGRLAEVIWGNHDAIDRQLCGLGETRELTDWFAREHCKYVYIPK
jgi:uncharacterized protein